jgi:4-hydroxy-tetrahydrodipicolinate reductase
MNVILHGCNGRMGQVVANLISQTPDMKIVCGIDRNSSTVKHPFPVYDSFLKEVEDADVVIDFSYHTCIYDLLQFGKSRKIPLVICTTGFTEEEKGLIVEASKIIPVLHSGNMSVGINLVLELVKKAADSLYGDFDIEIVEKHHNQKVDAPSGTALMIADAINETINNEGEYVYERASVKKKRKKEEIGMHAIRGGTIVGEHEVIFAGPDEIIEIKHTALSRNLFAHGAIRAARFLHNQPPGLYSMKNVIS